MSQYYSNLSDESEYEDLPEPGDFAYCADINGDTLNCCCGIVEVGDFFHFNEETILRDLEHFKIDAEGDKRAALLATTIASQKAAIAALTKFGFHRTPPLKRGRGGNAITIWIYELTPTKRKKK